MTPRGASPLLAHCQPTRAARPLDPLDRLMWPVDLGRCRWLQLPAVGADRMLEPSGTSSEGVPWLCARFVATTTG